MKVKDLEWESIKELHIFGGIIIFKAPAMEGNYLIIKKEKDYLLSNQTSERSYQDVKEKIKTPELAKTYAQKHFEKEVLKKYFSIKKYLIKE